MPFGCFCLVGLLYFVFWFVVLLCLVVLLRFGFGFDVGLSCLCNALLCCNLALGFCVFDFVCVDYGVLVVWVWCFAFSYVLDLILMLFGVFCVWISCFAVGGVLCLIA